MPLIPIVGTGLRLKLNKEVVFRTLGVLVAHGEDSAPWITFVSSHFSDIFPQLLSFFEWSMLTQLESPNAGHLFFVALDVYCNTQEGMINRNFLLRHLYKLEVSTCSYDMYSVRCTFSKNFKGFSSRLDRLDRRDLFPPYLKLFQVGLTYSTRVIEH